MVTGLVDDGRVGPDQNRNGRYTNENELGRPFVPQKRPAHSQEQTSENGDIVAPYQKANRTFYFS